VPLISCMPCCFLLLIWPLCALQASALIKYVQSMRGRRLWPAEDVCLDQQQQLVSTAALASMVQHCLDAFDFEPELRQAWIPVALDWALHARSRHLACRSQQVVRSLQPLLTGDMCSTLLLCLQQCLGAPDGSVVARDVALELLLTLRELVEALPARKLLLYPQVNMRAGQSFTSSMSTPRVHSLSQPVKKSDTRLLNWQSLALPCSCCRRCFGRPSLCCLPAMSTYTGKLCCC